jgi:hypothetical protein
MKYRQTFTVRGRFRFPIDMLRYDEAFPATEIDSGKIHHALEPGCEPWEVMLARYTETKDDYPTFARWESFSVTVDDKSIQIRKL